jgi:hypothetical protein
VTPQIVEKNKHLRFTNGTVVGFDGQSGVLVVDVGGFVLSLQVTGATEVRGNAGAARVVSGEAKWDSSGSLVAQLVEVVC